MLSCQYLRSKRRAPSFTLAVSRLVAFRRLRRRLWRSPVLALGLFSQGAAGCLAARRRGFIGGRLLWWCRCFRLGSGLMFGASTRRSSRRRGVCGGYRRVRCCGMSARVVVFAVEVLPDVAPWASLARAHAPAARCCSPAPLEVRPKGYTPMFDTCPTSELDPVSRANFELQRPLLCVTFSAFIVGIVRVGSLSGVGSSGQTGEQHDQAALPPQSPCWPPWRFCLTRDAHAIPDSCFAHGDISAVPLLGDVSPGCVLMVFQLFSIVFARRWYRARGRRAVSLARARAASSPAHRAASSLVGSVVSLFVGAGRGVGLAELSVVALVAVYALSGCDGGAAWEKRSRQRRSRAKSGLAHAADVVRMR